MSPARRSLAWAVLAALLLAAAVAGAAWAVGRARARDPWLSVLSRDFAAPATPTDDLTLGFWGTSRLQAPRREASGPLLLRSQEVLQLPALGPGSLRLSAEIEWPERVDGFEIGLDASPYPPRAAWEAPPCYICQFGGYDGRRTFAAALRSEGTVQPPVEVAYDWRPARRYRVAFEIDGGRMTQTVDGVAVLELFEPLPVGDDSYRGIFLRSWAPSLRIHSLRVERIAEGIRPNPHAAGDALQGAGLHQRAVDAYLRVAAGQPGSAVAEQAIAKAFVAATADPALEPAARSLLARLAGEHPGSPLLRSCTETWAVRRFAAGDPAALDLAAGLLVQHPGSRVAEAMLRDRPPLVPAGMAEGLLGLLGRTRGAEVLGLAQLGLGDLAALGQARLRILYLDRNRIADLRPLAGQPIGTLGLAGNPLADLTPLAGMPLGWLDLSRTAIADLGQLAGLPLDHLHLRGTRVADLAPLAGGHLVELGIADTAVADLAPLRGMALERLDCTGSRVADLAPLAGNPALRRLYAARSRIADLAPVQGLHLGALDASDTAVTSLAGLAGMPLSFLSLRGCRVDDLGPLQGAPLDDWLDLRRSTVRDLAPLAQARLSRLLLPGGAIDLAPLRGQPLAMLGGDGLVRPDLAMVAQDRLRELRLQRGVAVDLAPLIDLGLEVLDLSGCAVESLDPLLRMPALRDLRCIGCRPAQGGLAATASALRRQGRRDLARQLEIAVAVEAGDGARLQDLAEEMPDGRLRLELGLRCRLDEARALATRLGALLPAITSLADHARLRELLVHADSCWLDLAGEVDADGLPAWPDGSRLAPAWLADSWMDGQGAPAGGWHLLRKTTAGSVVRDQAEGMADMDQGVVLEWVRRR